MKQTKSTKLKDIKRQWHLIDAKDKILGRVSSEIALFLMGKAKSDFVRNLDLGDYVVVINAKDVRVTGNKESLKNYYRHSGYPGGFKKETLSNLRERKPEEIIIHAVSGMLPQNKLKAKMLKRLYVSADKDHTYGDKFKAQEVEK
ncbi:MAG: 50S ribosomal protein L13 [Patescibacteria group bacterium]